MTKEWKGSLDEQRNINDDNNLENKNSNSKFAKVVVCKHKWKQNTWKNKKYINNKKLWERCENNKNKNMLKEGNRKFTSWGIEI
jgi:hypothetical protein